MLFTFSLNECQTVIRMNSALTGILKWWKNGLIVKLSKLLNLSDGSGSQDSFPLTSGNAATLYDKQDGISKQANPQSMLSSTRSEPRLVMFKNLNMSGLKLTKATPGGEPRLRPEKKQSRFLPLLISFPWICSSCFLTDSLIHWIY